MAFPPLGNSDHVILSVSIDFPSNSQWDALLHHISYDYSHAEWDGLCDHGRISLRLVLLLLLVNFVSRLEFDVNIPHRKYQIKPHSSPWFSAACVAAIVHRNHCFVCTKRINLQILK